MHFGTFNPLRNKPLTLWRRLLTFLLVIPVVGVIVLATWGGGYYLFLMDPGDAGLVAAVIAGGLLSLAIVLFGLHELGFLRFYDWDEYISPGDDTDA
jgi:hypothetical protein